MLRAEIEQVKQICRTIAKEEIALAIKEMEAKIKQAPTGVIQGGGTEEKKEVIENEL